MKSIHLVSLVAFSFYGCGEATSEDDASDLKIRKNIISRRDTSPAYDNRLFSIFT